MTDSFAIRPATPTDAALIALHRRLMFADMRDYAPSTLEAMETAYNPWVKSCLERGEYLGWLAENERHEVIGGVGLWLYELLPSPGDLSCQRGHVVDVYVRPEYRRRGLARRLMQTLLVWCTEHEIPTVTLAASRMGRPLYRSLGFEASNTMHIHVAPPA